MDSLDPTVEYIEYKLFREACRWDTDMVFTKVTFSSFESIHQTKGFEAFGKRYEEGTSY